MSLLHRFLSTTCLTVAMAAAFGVGSGGNLAMANPQDGVVVGGAANIISNGNKLDIIQTTDRAVINWNKFDIAPDEHTQFYQPNSSSIILNRINSTTSSTIAGKLTSNGNVILVNPNGILFSKTATVDVNGLVATTADIDDQDFMGGGLNFNKTGNPNATIENQGLITAKESGLVGLVAPNVINSGVINAKLGRAQLSSGDSVTVDFYGDGLLEVKASDALTSQTVTNTGVINAAGGTIAMTAAAARYTVNSVVKVSGELHAPSVGVRNGKIIIGAAGSNAVTGNKSADKGKKTGVSTVLVDGVLDVSGKNPGETGGTITITADHIGILDGAKIDASGYNGGGTIHIGGDYLGQGETPTALVTIIQSGVDIKANALGDGNGGEVVVYSDNRTEFSGSIEAMGAGDDGNGGFTETSGKGNLLAMGTVRLTAGRRGKAGTWLMDPADITITAATNTSNTGDPNFTATATASQVSAASIKTNLDAGTNVTITTSNDAYAGNGDIIVSSAITTTGAGSLTLSAYRNITVSTNITLQGGSLVLRADNAANASGSVFVNTGGNLTTNGGNITIGGGSGSIAAGSGYAVGNSAQANGVYIAAGVNAGGGNIIINGQGANLSTDNNHGVYVYGGSTIQTSGTGNITINGIGGGNTTSATNNGIFTNGSTIKTTGTGSLTLVGIGGNGSGSGVGNRGLYINNSSLITATGGGAINITGIGSASSGGSSLGIHLNTSGITGSGGAMNITGTGGASSGNSNYGVYLISSGTSITNTGSGTLTITGTAAGSGSSGGNYGFYMSGSNTVSTVNGLLTINGYGGHGGTTGISVGVYLSAFSGTSNYVQTTGTGNIVINGVGNQDGSASNGGSAGLNMSGTIASIVQTTGSGNITITGSSNTTGATGGNPGVSVGSIHSIRATGSGNITISGTGSSSIGSNQIGVALTGTVSANGGNISVTGQGGGSATSYGIAINAGTITNTGSGAISLIGTGGASSSSDYGIYIYGGSIISTVDGALNVTGTGGGSGAGTANYGVYITGAGSTVKTTGTGALNVIGTGGNNAGSGGTNYGIYSAVANGIQTTGSGSITLKGVKGGQATSYGVFGDLASEYITTGTGNITVYTDTISLATANNINSAGILTIAPYTNGSMGVGYSTGYTLNLDNTTLGYINGASYVFGALVTGNGTTSSSDLTVNTTKDFVDKNVTFISGNDINLAGALTKATGTGTAAYLFQANRNIYNYTSAGITATTGLINLTLQSDFDGNSDGAISLSGGTFNTNGGNITIGGGSGTITAGSGYAVGNATYVSGVSIANILSANGGNIIINGKGYSTSTDNNYGVATSTSITTAGTGTISINGIGQGTGASATDYGVYLNTGTTVSSVNGNLSISGTSNGGTGTNNIGIYQLSTTVVQTSGAGNISLTGVSNASSGNAKGMYLVAGSTSATGSGNIVLTGTGSTAAGAGSYDIGIQLGGTYSINNSGTGSITITGTGGGVGGSSNNYGLMLQGANLQSVNGTINVNGFGGNLAGTGTGNDGVYSNAANAVKTTGTGSIIFKTAKGGGTSGNGLNSLVANGSITTGSGNITVYSDTISLATANAINAAGILTIAPYTNGTMGVGYSTGYTLNLDNTTLGYINGASYVFGATTVGNGALNTSDMAINTTKDFVDKSVTFISGNNINLSGALTKATGTGTVAYLFQANKNIFNSNNSGIAANTGLINLTLQSDFDGNSDGAVTLTGGSISTNGGNITMGGGSGAITAGSGYAFGNSAQSVGAYIASTLTAAGGNIIINGTSVLSATDGISGVQTTALISTTGTGTISLNGVGRGSANVANNYGVYLQAGITTVNGNISLNGTGGGAGTGSNSYGVVFSSAGGYTKTTGAGNITVTGTGGAGSGGYQIGVFSNFANIIQTTGTGTITVNGTGGASAGVKNYGVSLGLFSIGSMSSAGGDITINGTGGAGTGSLNAGISLGGAAAGSIINTGTGSITLNGTGSGTVNSGIDYGIYLLNTSLVSTVNGNVNILGIGGGAGTGASNYGVYVNGGSIQTTGTGALNVTGIGGNNAGTGGTNHGIYSAVANGIQTTGSGSITLKGIKGGQTTSYGVFGDLANEYITTGTGNITVYTDTISLATANNINSAGILTIAPYTNGTMGVGYSTGYTLNLDNTTLGYINGASYVFGATTVGNGSASTSDLTINTTRDFVDKNVTFIAGNNIIMAGTLTKATGTGTATYLMKANGNITNSSSAGVSATSGLINLTMTSDNDVSGAGNISLTSAPLIVNGGTITLNSNGQSVTQSGTIGGDETINSANGAVTIGSLNGDTAGTRSLTVNGGTSIFTTSAAIGNTNKLKNITISADDVAIGANIGGTGTLILQPTTFSKVVRVNNGTGDFNLSTAEITYLVDGWSSIIIGNASSAVDMFIGTSTWLDPITFRSAYRVTTASGSVISTTDSTAPITFNVGWMDACGTISSANAVTINNSSSYGYVSYGSTINATNSNVTFNNNVRAYAGSLTLNAGTGTITFPLGVNTNATGGAAYDLTATAGAYSIGGAIGTASSAIGNVTLTSTSSISLSSITTAAAKNITITVTGAGNNITTAGVLTAGTAGNMTLQADDLILGGNLVGTGALTLRPNSSSRIIRVNNVTGDFNLSTPEIAYLIDGWSSITIGNVSSSADMFVGTSTWLDPITFRSGGRVTTAAGSVVSTTDSTAPITFNVGWIDAYGTITSANAVTLSSSDPSHGYVSYGSTVNATNNNINFIGNLRLAYGALTLNAGTGTISLPSGVNTAAVTTAYDLTATAGTFSIGGPIGQATAAIGNVTLTSTNSISLPAITTAAGKTVNIIVTGAGNSITTTGAIATGAAGNISLTSDDVVLGENLSGTGTLNLRPYNNAVGVFVNRPGTGYSLSTAEIAYLASGWNQINIGKATTSVDLLLGASNWTSSVAFYTGYAIGQNGTVTGTNNITYGASLNLGSTTTNAGGNIVAGVLSTSGGVNFTSTNGNITTGTVRYLATGAYTTFTASNGTITLDQVYFNPGTGGNLTASAQQLNLSNISAGTGSVSLTSLNGLTLPSIAAANIFAQTTGFNSDIIIGAGNSLTASGSGNAITLVAGRNFINNSGSSTPLVLTGSGRYLVYSNDSTADTLAGMTSGFVRYGCTYGGSCPSGVTIPASGNGSIYVVQPILTVTPNSINTIYGDTVPSLTGYGYTVSGYLTGAAGADSGTNILTGSLTGATSYVQGNDVGTYNLNYSSGTLTSSLGYAISYANNASGISVGQRTLTTSLTGLVSKTYDATTSATLTSANYSLGNVYGSDALTITNTSGNYSDKNVGTSKNVTVTGLIFSGAKASNYILASSSVSGTVGTILQKALTLIGLGVNNKVYDATTVATLNGAASFSGIAGSDVVNLGGTATAEFSDANAGTGKAVTVSGYNISGTDANNYNFTQPTGIVGNINKALLTATANSQTVTYGTTVPSSSITYTGFAGGENSGVIDTLASLSSVNSGIINAGTYTGNYTASGAADNNYDFSYVAGTLTVNKKALNVTADGQTVTYGTNAPATTALSYNGFISGEDESFLISAPTTTSVLSGVQNVGTYTGNYSVSGGASNNYQFNYFTGNLVVTKKNLAVSADNKSVSYGTTTPLGTVTYNGFVNGEDATVLDVSPTVTSGLSGVVNAGTYAGNYVASGGSDTNYNLLYSSGSLVVTPVGVNVIANNQSVIYGTAVPTTTISYTGFVNGEDETVLLTAPTITSLQNGVVNAGSYIGNYIVSGATANNYTFNYMNGDLTVNKKALNITAGNRSISYGDAIPSSSLAYSGFISGEDESYLLTAPIVTSLQTGIVNAGIYVGNYVLSGGASNNYSLNYVAGDLNVVKKTITIAANSQTVTYGTTVPGTSLTYTGFVNGENSSVIDSLALLSSANSGIVNAGTYAGNYTASGAIDNNYDFNYVAGSLIVNKALLTATANSQAVTYGTTVPNSTITYTGFVNGENSSVIDSLASLSSTNSGIVNAGVYASNYSALGAADNNYNFNYVDGFLVVNKALLTATANSQTMTYGATVPNSTITYTGFVNGENSGVIDSLASLSSAQSGVANAGTYTGNYVASGAADNNYNFNYVAGSLIVNKALLTATANNQTVTYGTVVPVSTITYTGFVNGDNSGVIDTLASLSSANSGVVNTGIYTGNYTASGAVDNNYNFNYVSGSLIVNKALLTATANSQTVIYGTTVPNSTITYTGFVNGENSGVIDSLASLSSAQSGVVNAGTYTGNYVASGAADNNYNFNYVIGNLTVLQRALTVTTADVDNSSGTITPVFTGSNNLLAADAALITWGYAPVGYNSGDAGIYIIGATANDPSNRLNNYIRTNHYGFYNVGVPPAPLAPTIPFILPQVLSSLSVNVPISTFVILDVPVYNSNGEVVSTKKEWVDTSNLSNSNQLQSTNDFMLSYSDDLKRLLAAY